MNRPVKTKSEMLLTTQEEQLKRWEEHFFEIFNKDDDKTGSKQEGRNAKENSSKNNNERETVVNLDPPTKTEIQLALTQLKNGKAAGLDNISPQVLKVNPETTVEMLYPLLEKIWKEEKIPEEWKEELITEYQKKET